MNITNFSTDTAPTVLFEGMTDLEFINRFCWTYSLFEAYMWGAALLLYLFAVYKYKKFKKGTGTFESYHKIANWADTVFFVICGISFSLAMYRLFWM